MHSHTRFIPYAIIAVLLVIVARSVTAQDAPDSPAVSACLPGAGYTSGCDVDQDNDIDINDIQLTAGRWNTSGAYTSGHNHWGETWTGTGPHGLRLENTDASGTTYGLWGQSASTAGRGVFGYAKAGPYRARAAYAWTAEAGLYLAPDRLGGGVGTALYRALIDALRARGFRSVIGGVALPNPRSEALHARLGFAPVGVVRRAGWKHGAWRDVGFWQLALVDDDAAPAGPPGE